MCGVIGIIGGKDAAYDVFRGLMTLQHRGQDAAGILSFDRESHQFYCQKNQGLVNEVFQEHSLNELRGEMAIGHNRYSTVGTGELSELQPMMVPSPYGIGMVHNGNVVNYFDLAEEYRRQQFRHIFTHNDLEMILSIFSDAFSDALGDSLKNVLQDGLTPFSTTSDRDGEQLIREALPRALKKVLEKVKGGYSVVGMIAGKGMFAFRDSHGIRPLVIGQKGNQFCFSSETGALSFLDFIYLRSVRPGELIFVNYAGELSSFQVTEGPSRPCMFEWIYFAGSESLIEDIDVHSTRSFLGKYLAAKMIREKIIETFRPDVVVPVPETGRVAAITLAKECGVPYQEVLIKNRYVYRSFILDNQLKREKAVELKLIPIRSEIEGKKIILVDDSIVRGTTAKHLVKMMKNYGAREIILVSTCPPIRYPCFYGIDFPDKTELIANKYDGDEEKIAQFIGVEKIVYLDREDLKKILKRLPCMSCIDGDYPVKCDQSNFEENRKNQRQLKLAKENRENRENNKGQS